VFMEGIRDIVKFSASCLRALEHGVPVIVFRVGVTELGAKLAATHTSSLIGQNELYDALFKRLGILVADSVPQFLELLKIASLGSRARGNRLAVFSSSGGDNGMAADFTSGVGLSLPTLNDQQRDAIRPRFPDFAHISNPLDFTSQYWGDEDGLYPILREVLADGYDRGLMVIDHPVLELGQEQIDAIAAMVRAMGRACRDTGVPGVVASVNPESMPAIMRRQVIDEGMVPLQGLHDAGPVLGMWTAYCARIGDVAGKNTPLPVDPLPPDTPRRTINEYDSKARLAAYGLPVPRAVCATPEELESAAATFDGPLVLKVLHDDLPHKTEAGGVVLGLEGPAAVCAAAGRIIQDVGVHRPDLVVERFLLEEMAGKVAGAPLLELLLGVKRDVQFGLVMVIAAGGIMVELMQDSEQLLLPVSASDIEDALKSLKVFPLLDGFRGRPGADLKAVTDAIAAIAAYAVEHRDSLMELDVNPLLVFPETEGVLAVDALIVEAAD